MLVYGECECFVMQMLYVCVLCASCGSSQCCVLHDLSMSSFFGGMGTMLSNVHMCGIMLVLRAVFQHAREECESKRAYVF